MSLLDSICEWAQTLLDWQGDAVRRLLLQEDFTEKDLDEIICILKAKHDLPVKYDIKSIPLQKGDVSGAPSTSAKIILKALVDLKNVNKIPDGSGIEFGDSGLTVLYGENGTGKSGYTRVLKRACRARDTSDQVIPNVFAATQKMAAKATFNISVDGVDKPISWIDGQQSDTILTNICVFDTKCARVIIDKKNEMYYLPYGTHVFAGLVSIIGTVKKILQAECPVGKEVESSDIQDGTEAAKFLSALSKDTTDEQIDNATTWSEDDEALIKQLTADVAKAEADDPLRQAKRLRDAKNAIAAFRGNLQKLHSLASNENEIKVKGVVARLNSAIRSCELAETEDFSKEPLQGIGSDPWKSLYEAAKAYSVNVAYKDTEFPAVGEGKVCVLCMQELNETAKERLSRFKNFMENATQEELKSAKDEISNTLNAFEGIKFKSLKTFASVLDEICAKDEDLKQYLCDEYLPNARMRVAKLLRVLRKYNICELPLLLDLKVDEIVAIEKALEEEAVNIEKAANPEELQKLKKQLTELQGRRLLSQRKKSIIDRRDNISLRYKYLCCDQETDTTQITRRGRELVTEAFTPALLTVLKGELTALGVKHLPINLGQSGERGTTQHKILLDGCKDNTIALTQILSEGEQKAMAIAGFLAELNTGHHTNPIVFDDPVCSLDHRYREKTAERLAIESKKRQVIIFTHDIAFLMQLGLKASENDAEVTVRTICRNGNDVGYSFPDLPWHALPTSKRIGYLRNEHQKIKELYGKGNPDDYNHRAAHIYNLLRETWEAFIEEVLLNGTVIRHQQEIQTNRLKGVAVTDDDYKAIDEGMSKCSSWMFGHDKSKALDVNRPDPDELLSDINALEEFRKATLKNIDAVKKKRP